MRKFLLFLFTLLSVIGLNVYSQNYSTAKKITQNTLLKNENQINELLNKMTLEEKVGMLHAKHMFVSSGVERLGIADINYADGPFGIREELQPNGWSPLGWTNDRSTFFPTGSALAATWSPQLAYNYGKGLSKEARLRGKDMILGPAINIQRIPTCGRTYEYLSEDPFLSAVLAINYTQGAQENGSAVCLKHFALNNQENNRGIVDVIVGERAKREIYYYPFEKAVKQGGAFGIMSAYNKIDGRWCSENKVLLNDVLREDWNFKGMVISDWGGTHSTVDAVASGLNVEMPDQKYMGKALLDSVKAGVVSENIINQRVREILRVRLAIKAIPENEANKQVTSQPAQQKIAYEVAAKSIVLLKNEGILPLNLSKKPVIAVIGSNAEQIMAVGGLGAGVKALYEVTPLDGLKTKIGKKAILQYARGYEQVKYQAYGLKNKVDDDKSEELKNEALTIASQADIVLFVCGDNRAVETEGRDRTSIKLPSDQDNLLCEIAKVNNNIVTIITSGAPNDLRIVNPLSRALLVSWFNGSEGGNALADILIGKRSPSGHLPFTYPMRLEDSPAYAFHNYPQGDQKSDIFAKLVAKTEDKGEEGLDMHLMEPKQSVAFYSEESLVGYRWFDTKNIQVMYPFGHGLTYTTFHYSNLKTNKDVFGPDDIIKISVTVKNVGNSIADEVIQAYVHRINSPIQWPYKELKAFARTSFKVGESKIIKMQIPVKDLRYWNEQNNDWEDDLCNIELQVGCSSQNIRVKKSIALK